MQRHGGDFNIMYILLFCLCRQQQRLEHHDDRRDELERKEKGFMLYVNGANAAPSSVKTARTARRPKSCHKTAADCKACCLYSLSGISLCCSGVLSHVFIML